MEILNPETQKTKAPVPPGTVILLQGDESRSFTILHSGMVELLFSDTLKEGDTPEEIIASSLRIGLVKGEAMIGIIGLLSNNEFPGLSVRTVSKCIISSQPVRKEEMLAKVQRDNTLNFKMLRDLCGRVESSIYLYTNYKYLWHKYASIADSLALGFPGKPGSVYDEKSRTNSSLQEYSAFLKGMIKEDPAAALPEEWDYNLFLGRIQDNLRLYEDHDRVRAEDLLDYQQCLFLKRLVHKNDKILTAIFSKDEPSNRYIFDFMAKSIVAVAHANKDIAAEIKELMDRIYSDEGWAAQIIKEEKSSEKSNFLHFLAKFSWRCRKDTITLLGIDLFKEYRVFGALKRYQEFKSQEDEQQNSGTEHATEEMKKRLEKYRGLLTRILNFSTMDEEFKKSFAAGMEELLQYKNKHDTDPALQRLRDRISGEYWKLYENCFLKVIDSDLKGFVPGIMLHFGIVDERLLTDEELYVIDRFYSANLFMDEDIPVMTLPYFLEKIYKSEIPPSMTEMGDYFTTILKNQEKMTKKEKAASVLYEDTAEDKVRFELRTIAGDLSKMLFGNKKRALPFLCSDSLSGGAKRFFIDPELFTSLIRKYRKRDYSLFYREVLFKHKLGSDFIQKEVIPNFVFYPSFGNRSVMWQEMDGTNKKSPGRIFYPLFFTEKLEQSALTQLAYFRWELQKSIAGYNWTDPVEGGVVGVYYDYIQYYRKNPNITPEAKERLAEFIKKTKSDKDRFAQDYANWVAFEYEGKMRLNGYVRDIFYRFCPFPGKIREVMAQKPDFKVMENRFQSRRLKDSLRLKSKMIKFEKKGVPLPGELIEYSRFLER